MESYYYNSSTILKYLRKVLNEINRDYVDSGLRAGFIMKRYCAKYGFDEESTVKLILLCMLKDIGSYYQNGEAPEDDPAKEAASSYCFLKYCSPLKESAKPLLFYKAHYLEGVDSDDYKNGLLITLIDQVVMYIYEEYTLEEIERMLKNDACCYDPAHIKRIIKLLKDEEDILIKLNQTNSLFIHEVCAYVQNANYSDVDLLSFIDMTNYSFEFHNHETLAHTVTTAIIARELAKLNRLTDNQVQIIYLAALVHDIGKIRVPVSILCFPGRLEGDDLREMRNHVVYTKEILEGSFSYQIVDIAANHHERLDGSGYPRKLQAIDLSIGDKIIAVADVVSALYCKRSYKSSFPQEKIIEIIEGDASNGKIDKRIVNRFVENMDDIMFLAKEKETEVLEAYENMKKEYQALAESDALARFFEE